MSGKGRIVKSIGINMTVDIRPYLVAAGLLATAVAVFTFHLLGYPYATEVALITGAVTVVFTWAIITIAS